VPDLIKRAYSHENAARYLLVKGEKDYIADKDGIIAVVDSPNEPPLEPLTAVAHKYGLDLEQLLADLEKCAGSSPHVSP